MKHVRPRKFGRIAATAAVAAAVGIGISVTAPESAQAATVSGLIKNHATKRCLDSDTAGKVYIRGCQKGNPHQTWEISSDPVPSHARTAPDGRSRFQIRNRATQMCLYIAASGGVKGILGTYDCASARPETIWIDGAGTSFNSVHWRGWHGFTGDRPFCVTSYTHAATVERCNYSAAKQRWSRVA
ncbi:RICIN domain-containing protein [Streptomyces sp. NPDC020681]|uniref:RICIN domain-containing protein n=1 Tax=Streptomyces sp. NPDC020681 TaxID=3365083 RepID=UPI00379BAC10